MLWNSLIRAAVCMLSAVLIAAGIFFVTGRVQPTVSAQDTTEAATPEGPGTVFSANPGTLGSIPDGVSPCPTAGAPRNVTFNVSGLTGSLSNIAVSMTFAGPAHTFMGDITATLIAPNAASHVVFARTGATTATGFGDSSDLAGPYTFADSAGSPPSGGWWQEATVRGASEAMTSGLYRTTAAGGAGQTNPAPATNMTAAFSGVPNLNGTWTLRLTDSCNSDTGAISAASLTITTGALPQQQHVVDFNGDGRTDFSVARNVTNNIVWYNYDGVTPLPGGFSYQYFGLPASDYLVPEDYDGDNKTDIAVWREAAAGVAAFYILQSSNGTVRTEPFGMTGDDPAVVGDYDGDNKADPTVYRCPPFSGSDGQCYFYYKASSNGALGVVPFGFGVDGDFFPYVGDFDGDGRNDYCIQRANPSNPTQGQFVLLKSSGGSEFIDWGTSSDFLIPGDYDGDGRTDICVRRTIGGFRYYFVLTRTGAVIQQQWGITGDSSTPGDYDGDGKTDFAVWRGSTTPGQSAFYILNSGSGSVRGFQWGQCPTVSTCDFAVAGWAVH